MLFAFLGAMLLAAVLTVALPLYRQERRLSTSSTSAIVIVLLISIAVYSRIGTPDADSEQPGDVPGIEEMVAALDARLRQSPDDLAGWKMLGRSYLQLGNTPAAIAAYQRASEMEGGENGQTLADLGEAMLISEDPSLAAESAELFERAVEIAPDNQKVLFYAGMIAVQRGDKELGAARWEKLLASAPPENIRQLLVQRIAELRGDAPAPAAALPAGEAVVTVGVSLGDLAAAAVQPGATVFVIARDPAQPSPPIVAVRRKASELPADVTIGDSDAMTPGRVPSGFAQLEIVARVSISGQPMAQAGDWFGQRTVSIGNSAEISIVIDQRVP